MNKSRFLLILGLVLVTGGSASAQNGSIDLQSLLKEMINREHIARYPDPYYTTRQFSSYDRDATQPGDSTWFANWDRSQFLRVEHKHGRKEYVMLDTNGPGAIVRFWMTFAGDGAGQGTLRIYFDGKKEPTIEGPAMEVLSGGKLVGMPLSMSVSPKTTYKHRGHNLYLPLPYDEHCTITYQSNHIKGRGARHGGESVYYNISYRDYEGGTKVNTFSKQQLSENEDLLRRVQERLLFRDKDYQLAQMPTESKSARTTIKPGESHSIKVNGPAAIRRLSVKLDAQNRPQALRSTIMQISFDGKPTVWTPVGDFFGTGYQIRPSDTWYTTVTEGGQLRAYWVMPFRDEAEITFKNLGEQEVSIEQASVTYSDWQWDAQSMYFGASWHQYSDLQTGGFKTMNARGNPFDINYTELQGRGVYVGDALALFNTSYAWWGEGDEKIYIDGEDFPSHFGTGTEDYYGYAWARPTPFTSHPFISQPDGSGNITPGYTINLRYCVLDALPFQSHLTVDMEMWHWASTIIDYAPTTFYYLRPDAEGLVHGDPKEAQKQVALKRSDLISPAVQDGRMEAENMVMDSYTGAISFQHLDKFELSGGKQFWWRNGKAGDRLKAHFISDKAGTFSAIARFVVAPDYGIADLFINGQRVLDYFDAYNDEVDTRTVELEKVPLHKGKNTMTIKLVGKNKASKNVFFGLDYIDFQ